MNPRVSLLFGGLFLELRARVREKVPRLCEPRRPGKKPTAAAFSTSTEEEEEEGRGVLEVH